MQASDVATIAESGPIREATADVQNTAARLNALLRHLFLYDRGNLLRVIEESGLTITQCKALLVLAGRAGHRSPGT